MNMTDDTDDYDDIDDSTTVEAAVERLLELMPDADKTNIAAMAEGDLVTLHFGLGQWIRNNFGLWRDNPELLLATGKTDADEASGVIVRAFWQRLRDELPKVH
jgi:hypothetical protein